MRGTPTSPMKVRSEKWENMRVIMEKTHHLIRILFGGKLHLETVYREDDHHYLNKGPILAFTIHYYTTSVAGMDQTLLWRWCSDSEGWDMWSFRGGFLPWKSTDGTLKVTQSFIQENHLKPNLHFWNRFWLGCFVPLPNSLFFMAYKWGLLTNHLRTILGWSSTSDLDPRRFPDLLLPGVSGLPGGAVAGVGWSKKAASVTSSPNLPRKIFSKHFQKLWRPFVFSWHGKNKLICVTLNPSQF